MGFLESPSNSFPKTGRICWRGIPGSLPSLPWPLRLFPHLLPGLSPQASLEEIKAAYRRRVREIHPARLPADFPEGLQQLAQRDTTSLSNSQQR